MKNYPVIVKINWIGNSSALNYWQRWIKGRTKPTDGCSNTIIRYHKAILRFDYVPYNYNNTDAICVPLRDNTSSPNFLICCVALRLAFSSLNKRFFSLYCKTFFSPSYFSSKFSSSFLPIFSSFRSLPLLTDFYFYF